MELGRLHILEENGEKRIFRRKKVNYLIADGVPVHPIDRDEFYQMPSLHKAMNKLIQKRIWTLVEVKEK